MNRTNRGIERVLQVHTRYREVGGEERVLEAERQLLESAGISVRQVIFDNADLHEGASPLGDIALAGRFVWNRHAAQVVRSAVSAHRPDAVHVHNTFAAASASVYGAAGMPVVQTLHNYRFFCPAATAFRDSHVCTDCLGRTVPWPAVAHRCVRGSRSLSLAAGTAMTFHRVVQTYKRTIGAYVALTEFQRGLMADGGMPRDRIEVIPNFLEPDPGVEKVARSGVAYVGRLSLEKGIAQLLQAAQVVPGLIRLVGAGPLDDDVSTAAAAGLVAAVGQAGSAEVVSEMRGAIGLVVPSIWFEGCPMVIIEAFATGTPVIASRIGSLGDIVEDGVTGLLVRAGDADDLGRKIQWSIEHPTEMARMGGEARRRYESRYRGPAHLDALLAVYQKVGERTVRSAPREAGPRTPNTVTPG